jgi:hypothetical protein
VKREDVKHEEANGACFMFHVFTFHPMPDKLDNAYNRAIGLPVGLR